MKISLNWIKDFVDLPSGLSAKQLAEDLTLATVEVEEVIDQREQYANMVVGEITEINDHPNADKLKVCFVSFGDSTPPLGLPLIKGEKVVQIICGGKNIYEGMKCAVALPGAKVKWHGVGDLVTLEEAVIRGEKSFGMICSAIEIGLTDEFPVDEPYVMDLKEVDNPVGTLLADALGLNDVILDIDNKSLTHRPDLWGLYGIARELAAIYKLELKPLVQFDVSQLSSTDEPTLDVRIENKELCPRFVGCVIDNISTRPSPEWLQQRLRAVGQRPVNNIVDITNYVMFEVGEPTHAYDKTKVDPSTGLRAGSKKSKASIIVRNAKQGEVVQTLDGKKRKLTKDTLVIADEEKAIAVAGVMGGANTEVDEHTTGIIFEAANFNAQSVRKTTQALNHRTEGSTRWEKALDPALSRTGMLRALALIREILPDARISQIVDIDCSQKEPTIITLSHEFLARRIGADFGSERVAHILTQLGFVVVYENGVYTVTVPSWRATGDISIPEDIVEEVARVYGYNKIPFSPPMFTIERAVYQKHYNTEKKIKEFLAIHAGMHEVYTYPWVGQRMMSALELVGETQELLALANPPGDDTRHLARSLVPNMLGIIEGNLRYKDSFRVFEVASVFFPHETMEFSEGEKLPKQSKRLIGAVVAKNNSIEDVFYTIKGIVIQLLTYTHIEYNFVLRDEHAWLSNGFELGIVSGDFVLGECGILNRELARKLKIDAPVGLCYLNWDELVTRAFTPKLYHTLPEFPPVMRDIALVINQTVRCAEIERAIKESGSLLESAVFFDMYEGKQVGEGKRSLAWHLYFRHPERTLTTEEADNELAGIVKILKERFGAQLRG